MSFEEDNVSNPVVIGFLSIGGTIKSISNIVSENLKVNGTFNAGVDTKIGDITYTNLQCLKDLKISLITKLEWIDNAIAELEATDVRLAEGIRTNQKSIQDLQEDNARQDKVITNNTMNIGRNAQEISTIKSTYLTNPAIMMRDISYGDRNAMNNLTNVKEGQLFLLLKEE